jgi:hypothetical protein
MPTGACGINCDVCRLNLLGVCSSCGSGIDKHGLSKMAVMERVLGAACPILECAVKRRVAYCPRDCDDFPCDTFTAGTYPYGEGYLNMQRRRRTQPERKDPGTNDIQAPQEHWADLAARNIDRICSHAGATRRDPSGILLPFFNEDLLVDWEGQAIFRRSQGMWKPLRNPLLELICLVYLLGAGPARVNGVAISAQELKTRHFFTGPHVLDTRSVLTRYAEDPDGFEKAAEAMNGEILNMADQSYRFQPFPKVPLYYLLWRGDEEFGPNLSILFDSSIEAHLPADGIWGLVKLTSRILVLGGKEAFHRHSA